MPRISAYPAPLMAELQQNSVTSKVVLHPFSQNHPPLLSPKKGMSAIGSVVVQRTSYISSSPFQPIPNLGRRTHTFKNQATDHGIFKHSLCEVRYHFRNSRNKSPVMLSIGLVSMVSDFLVSSK